MIAPIRVLIADDSPSVCRVLAAHLRTAPECQVVESVHSGEAAIERVAAVRPDVLTLDLDMPGIGGLAALDRIMSVTPTPVVLLTGVGGEATQHTVAGLSRGAVDFQLKYSPGRDTDPVAFGREVVAKVRTAAGVKVIRSLPRISRVLDAITPAPLLSPAAGRVRLTHEVIVIGASTGGPAAVRELLAGLPRWHTAGVLVVQHLPARFTRDLATLLTRQTRRDVCEADDGAKLEPGTVLVAPGDRHAALGPDGRVRLSNAPKVNGHRPSIDIAMESVARVFGPRAAGVILTGMGEDGVRGLAAVRAAGGRTFAQDEASSVVYGMPQRAAQVGAAGEIDTPAGIAARLAARRD